MHIVNRAFVSYRRATNVAIDRGERGLTSDRLPAIRGSVQRAFLKWAGGKSRLVAAIRALVPAEAERLIEPFVGSGVVAANLALPRAVLADANADLISVYEQLGRGGEYFIAECGRLFTGSANTAATYYRRREEFNRTKDARRKAALFLYLNRHGYNGLCRYNLRGGYNVPFGRYVGPKLPAKEMRYFLGQMENWQLRAADFRDVLAEAGAGDFVYCDPPYVPVSATANFTAYAAAGFGPIDQADLATACQSAAARGATVVISNHDTAETRRLYAEADERRRFLMPRRISCLGSNRQAARELLVVYRPAVVARSA